MKYITIDHILADIPYLVNKVKEELNSSSSKVITFGSRIGGAVAVLARKKFPHVVDGAWSSSGLFQSEISQTEFFDDIAVQLFNYGSVNCTNSLSKAFQQLKEIVEAKNIRKLQKLFRISSEAPMDLGKPQDVQYFYNILFKHIPLYIHTLK